MNGGRSEEETRKLWGSSIQRLGAAITRLPQGFPLTD